MSFPPFMTKGRERFSSSFWRTQVLHHCTENSRKPELFTSETICGFLQPETQLRPRETVVLTHDHPLDTCGSLSVYSMSATPASAQKGKAAVEWSGMDLPKYLLHAWVFVLHTFLSVYKWVYVTFKIRGKVIKVEYSKLLLNKCPWRK